MTKKRGLIFGGALLGFAIIAYFVCAAQGGPTAFDTAVRDTILSWRNDFLSAVLISITYLGNSNTIVALCILGLVLPNRLKYGVPLSLGAICSSSIQTVIKHTIERPRPDVATFLIEQGGYSFPSGHSCTGLMFYGLLAYLIWRHMKNRRAAPILSITACCLAFLIGFSRIYVGVHYPTDVLAGWCLGSAILILFICVYERLGRK